MSWTPGIRRAANSLAGLLLDTHAFLWWLAGDARLSKRARSAISDESNDIFVSAATAWEIATKVRLVKLPLPALEGAAMLRAITSQGFHELSVTVAHGERAGSLAGDHRDPFDRMLIAQAHAEAMSIVSNEAIFEGFGVTRVW
ncbi:MAG: type II toxin-antitoxin system VapC family toxin [Gemmatimonadaceae bacterium]